MLYSDLFSGVSDQLRVDDQDLHFSVPDQVFEVDFEVEADSEEQVEVVVNGNEPVDELPVDEPIEYDLFVTEGVDIEMYSPSVEEESRCIHG